MLREDCAELCLCAAQWLAWGMNLEGYFSASFIAKLRSSDCSANHDWSVLLLNIVTSILSYIVCYEWTKFKEVKMNVYKFYICLKKTLYLIKVTFLF